MITPKGTRARREERKQTMRYIDKTGCKSAFEKGKDSNIQRKGELTRAATKIAEENKLGLMKTRQGFYRIIKECGLGAYEDAFSTLAEVDDFFKHLDQHEDTKF